MLENSNDLVFPLPQRMEKQLCGCPIVELFPEVFQVTVTTFRRMFLLTVREAVNERRGERDGGLQNCLLLTARIASSSSTKIITLSNFLAFCVVHLKLKSEHELVSHYFLENVFNV